MNKDSSIPYVNPTSDDTKQFLTMSSASRKISPSSHDRYHRHDYQTIIFTLKGTSNHCLDNQSVIATAGTLLLIARGQVHKLKAISQEHEGLVVRFKDEFLPHTIAQSWNYQATLFNNLSVTTPIKVKETDILDFKMIFEQFQVEEARDDSFGRDDALRHLLQYLLIKIERLYRGSLLPQIKSDEKTYNLFQRFLTELEEDFVRHHDVTHYADKLHMSTRHLADLCKQVSGKSLKQMIVDRLVLEAKRYLQFTNLSIKEVAYALGYESHFYFSQAFKKATEQSPTKYRNNL